MLGSTHAMYGLIFAEILFIVFIKNSDEQTKYNRVMIWILGMFGGWFLDMDSIGGVFENILFTREPVNTEAFLRYHRDFSHSIGFLIINLIVFLYLISYAKVNYNSEFRENSHPLGQVPIEKDKWRLFGFVLIFIGFAFYNVNTIFLMFFFILGSMIIFGYIFKKSNKPFYGIAFFGGALLHHLCDFIACAWNPFGPWDPTITIGLYIYCNWEINTIYTITLFLLFELIPHIIGILIIIKTLKNLREYNKNKEF